MVSELEQKLDAVIANIEEIRQIFKVPSYSIGVIHEDEIIFTRGLGFSNNDDKKAPDQDTIYSLGSCTKAFTALALSILEKQGKFSWDDPVRKILPNFETPFSPVVGEKATVRDLLSHSTGLDQIIYTVIGRHGSVWVEYKHVLDICREIRFAADFRTKWYYNNWMFALASVLIEELSGQKWFPFVKENILTTLGLNRTISHLPIDDETHAHAYHVLDDDSLFEVALPSLSAGMAFDASGSLRSCLRDMLQWYRAHNKAWNQENSGLTDKVMNQKILERKEESLYHALRVIHDSVTTPYVLGNVSAPMKVIGHAGNLGGFLSVYWTFPESRSAVVVLANSFTTNGESTNLVSQVLIQELFDLQPRIDLIKVAREVNKNSRAGWDGAVKDWELNRKNDTQPQNLELYTGTYDYPKLHMKVEVFKIHEDPDIAAFRGPIQLHMHINDINEQTFPLYHYDNNRWSFMPKTRDDCRRLGFHDFMWGWKAWIIEFADEKDGAFERLSWALSGITILT